MVNAVSNSVVPKFTVIIGNSYGAGNYAMCGKAYDPRLIVAWPSAELAVMSGNSAAKVLLQIEKASLKKERGNHYQDQGRTTVQQNQTTIRRPSLPLLCGGPSMDRCHYRSLGNPQMDIHGY